MSVHKGTHIFYICYELPGKKHRNYDTERHRNCGAFILYSFDLYSFLYQYSITMINLMLNDLRRPAGVGFDAWLHFQGLILHLDSLIALTLTRVAEKRQAAFLGVVRAILLDDFGVKHHRIYARG